MTTWLATFQGPAMEARDTRAGERSFDIVHESFEADTEKKARALAEEWAEGKGEGLELVDIEREFE